MGLRGQNSPRSQKSTAPSSHRPYCEITPHRPKIDGRILTQTPIFSFCSSLLTKIILLSHQKLFVALFGASILHWKEKTNRCFDSRGSFSKPPTQHPRSFGLTAGLDIT